MVKEKKKTNMKVVLYYGNDLSIYHSLRSIAKIKKYFEIEQKKSFKKKSLNKSILILDDSYNQFIELIEFISLKNSDNLIITARKESTNLTVFEKLRIFVKPIKILDLYEEIYRKVKKYESPYKINLNISNYSIVNPKGKDLRLTEKEFKLMKILLNNNGEPLSKKKILSSVWGLELEKTVSLNTRVLETLISRIRRKIHSVNIKANIKKIKEGYLLTHKIN